MNVTSTIKKPHPNFGSNPVVRNDTRGSWVLLGLGCGSAISLVMAVVALAMVLFDFGQAVKYVTICVVLLASAGVFSWMRWVLIFLREMVGK